MCTRQYKLNMPQMHWGGMSENWLQKELGDMHWTMISDGLGVGSDKLHDSNGERLYASFVRLRWESNAGLFSFKENQQIFLSSELSRYGGKMFFSDAEIVCDNKNIKASLISVFSSRTAEDNKTLKKGVPLISESINIRTHEKLPFFAKQYLAAKTGLFASADKPEDLLIDLAGIPFQLNETPLYTQVYKIDPFDDVNGVGLLYFASYSKISDKCERIYFNEKHEEVLVDWAQNSSCLARDILYFGNANPNEALIYELNGWEYIKENRIRLLSSLYRKADGQLIAKILTIKELLKPVTTGNEHAPAYEATAVTTDDNQVKDTQLPINIIKSEAAFSEPTHINENVIYNRETVNKIIIDFLMSMLDIKNLTQSTDLKVLGIESIVFIELSEHLSNRFQLRTNPSRFYGLYTVEEITSYVLKEAGIEEETNSASKSIANKNDVAIEDIAIVGTAFRIPGASNEEEFWDMLIQGRSAISDLPVHRWNWPEWVNPATTHEGINRGGYINNIEQFDAAFFRVSPKEAELMDPQQRLLLELTWELLERAGYKASSQKGSRTGIYIGASSSDYELFLNDQKNRQPISGTGTSLAILANRLSYFFDFEGPSLQIDTACSSSLVAVHEAVKAIRLGECVQAIAGGVHLMCHPSRSLAYYQSNMLSVDGKCHTFDEKANGYVRGEGSVLFFLKSLSKAIADRDIIKGVIKSTAINHGGQTGGLTVPDPVKQCKLLEKAYGKANIDVSGVTYIEAHGTGTGLGDPIEVAGLTAAFNSLSKEIGKPPAAPWCGIGSVKTNIGHLEAASGSAGLLKILLSMKHGYLPPTINFDKLNPRIELQGTAFYIQHEARSWNQSESNKPLRAGVSSFGIGGVNAHVVLESFQQPGLSEQHELQPGNQYLFVLSAKNTERLKEYAGAMLTHITKHSVAHAELCFTLQTAREEMKERLAVVYQHTSQLKEALETYIHSLTSSDLYSGSAEASKQSLPSEEIIAMREWLAAAILHKIAKHWCIGWPVEWELLYAQQVPARISLPTYPFKRKPYWFKNRESNTNHLSHSPQPPIKTVINLKLMHLKEIEAKLSEIVCHLLYLDPSELDVNTSFIELGMDSVLGEELIETVNKHYNTAIKASRLYDYPSVTDLSSYIYEKLNTVNEHQTTEPLQESGASLVSHAQPESDPRPAAKIKLSDAETFHPADQQPVAAAKPLRLTNIASESITAPLEKEKPQHDPSVFTKSMEQIESTLATALCDLLYMERSELDKNALFTEVGLDSVLGIELIKILNRLLGTDLKMTQLYDHPTAKSLAAYIYEHHKATGTVVQAVLPESKMNSTGSMAFHALSVEGDLAVNKEAVLYYDVSVENNPCLRDHFVFRHHVLPADAFLEVLYSAFKEHFGHDRINLERIRISQPMIGEPGKVQRVKLELKELADGNLRYIISGVQGADETVYVRGFACAASNNEAACSLLKEPPAAQGISFQTEQLRTVVKGPDLVGCYNGIRRSVVFKEAYAIGELMICEEEGIQKTTYISQVLDGAILFAIQFAARLFNKETTEGMMYLPYQIERITINGPVSAGELYKCVLRCDEKGNDEALFSFKVTGEDGKVLFYAHGLRLRLITEEQLLQFNTYNAAPSAKTITKQTKVEDNTVSVTANTDVAIIGMSCRLPGADNITEYWRNLVNGIDSIEEITEDRWAGYDWYHPDVHHPNTSYSKWGGFINDTDKFDALFFGISPAEAEIMDPQQRLFLEESWKALEDAAYNPMSLARKKVSVFVGAGAGDYLHLIRQHGHGREGTAFTGSSQAILSARISYLLNLSGPSMAVDTACSSSLVAIDRAYQSILSGESEMALAGGVALMHTPLLHIWTSQVGMPSRNGRCRTFDDTADGIVLGEGVGVIVMKKLEAAIKDGDRIYAVIKGSGINQDGKTNGITAPSSRSQAELQLSVYRKYGIDPSSIGYVEAHGTGTKLGDPIEIEALSDSFGRFTTAKQYCAIGSAKTNIGHTSFTAGVAGMIKAVLMLKHGKYLPSLHFGKINREIDLKNTPFYVNTELRDWVPVPGVPRKAAIGSFGFSGTNAHVVIEEYCDTQKKFTGTLPVLIVLSAKNDNRLRDQALNLKTYLAAHPETNLHDLAYTLQVGREAMENRLAFAARDISEVSAILANYASGKKDQFFTGDAKANRSDFVLGGKAGKAYIDTALENREIHSLAQIWVRGVSIDWNLLYPGPKPQKISLPSYPFARERHWINIAANTRVNESVKLHPLVHKHNPAQGLQRYTSIYTGSESFLSDHIIMNQKTLPGVAYLEIARAAGELSAGKKVTCLKDVTWTSPIRVNEGPQQVHVNLYSLGEETEFKVCTEYNQEEVIHSRGKIITGTRPAPARVDIALVKERLKNTRDKKSCYELLKQKGYNLGTTFQGIDMQYYSEEEALAKISLPVQEGYMLTPGILDSSLHNCLGWLLAKPEQTMAVPFNVKEVIIYKELSDTIWSYARKNKSNKAETRINSFDVDVLNEEGEILLSFRGFVFLPLNGASKATSAKNGKIHLYDTNWQPSPIGQMNGVGAPVSLLVFLAGGTALLADKLKDILEAEVETVNAENEAAWFNYLLEKIKEKRARREAAHVIVVCRNTDYLQYGFVSGLLRTASLENLQISGKLIGVDELSISAIQELSEIITAEQNTKDVEVRYVNGERQAKNTRLIVNALNTSSDLFIKEGGVYLITGGIGGLGKIFASHISKIKNTKLILTGRSVSSPESDKMLAALNAVYIPCDVSDKDAVLGLIRNIKNRYHKINGIIHSAGLVNDSLIVNKTSKEVQAVFAPKIAGTKNLDEATREEALDFMVLFSSIASVLGNAGQSDYASANAYMDNYAHYRNQQVALGNRKGHTLSINWPLWQEGGMNIRKEVQAYLERLWGMLPMPAETGVRVFEQLLNTGLSQGIVLFGTEDKISTRLSGKPVQKPAIPIQKPTTSLPALDKDSLREKVIKKVTELASGLLKLDAGNIDNHKELGDYGFDSILLIKLSNGLNQFYDLDLMPVAFYNYPTIERLADFLVEDHYHVIVKRYNASPQQEESVTPIEEFTEELQEPLPDFLPAVQPSETARPLSGAIAVIGISGRFPASPDLETFWNNLRDNKDLITEVPIERWDWKKYYGDPLLQKNKTKAKWGGFISDLDKFDPLFFGISPAEAELMDPQQRMALQAVYHALEDAVISPDKIRGSATGVFIGVSSFDYSLLIDRYTDQAGEASFSTGAAHSMLVNRISYLLDLHGPSEPIDTACSSSLVAIHRAIESIRSGQCTLAIAGGVNALVSPHLTLSFSQAGMLSEEGRCKTFDQGANGYVRGDGVGMLVLKPLSQAEADGDRIYGVILGTAENHGGKANTLTSPNPQAQKEVLLKAYRAGGVDPGQVGYVETHGTGTPLGDPIEVEGLKLAFKELYRENNLAAPHEPYCALGSVKANIGHVESAAGVAGVMKVLLSLKHKMLPGNPHLKTPNAYLQLQDTPFYLQKETTEWRAINNRPRIAGVSSFGFGGANAHVIIEEYVATPKAAYNSNEPAIVVLSARNVERLNEQASNLRSYLAANTENNIHDIGYTLQFGREQMEERLAIVAHGTEELAVQLDNYLQGKATANIFRGNIKKEKADLLSESKASEAYLKETMKEKDPGILARLWVKGMGIDWNLLYPENKPRKISLPVYPFAKERYWIAQEQEQIQPASGRLHPLLHTNESNFSVQKYLSVFSGREAFFEDHKVRAVKVLPGAAQLELAREAGARSSGQKITQLKEVVFISPVQVFDDPVKVNISLHPAGEEIEFVIYNPLAEPGHVFSRGRLNSVVISPAPAQNLLLIRERLKNSMNRKDYYSVLRTLEIDYGKSFQGIESIYYNDDEVLSRISLPANKEYVLQPDLLDSAVQTVMGLSFAFRENPLVLPFSVTEVNIYRELPAAFWSYGRKGAMMGTMETYDVDLLNDAGEVLVSFRGFLPLPIDHDVKRNGVSAQAATRPAEEDVQLLYTPVWSRVKTNGIILEKGGKHLLVTGNCDTELPAHLKHILEEQGCSVQQVHELNEAGDGITDIYLLQGLTQSDRQVLLRKEYELRELAVFQAIKTLLASGYKEKCLNITVLTAGTQKVYAADHVREAGSGIAGLIGSLAKEQPLWNIRMIDLDGSIKEQADIKKILHLPYDKEGGVISFRKGSPYSKSLCPIDLPVGKAGKLRQGGTYVILGGAGGIGRVTTEYLIRKYKARVIWLGRRPLNEDILRSLDEMEKLGVRPQYFSCDAIDKASLEQAYRMIKVSHSAINGVFHSAIVLNDRLLRNMSEEDFRKSFEPKSLASQYLAETFKDEPLDFICFYSSIQSHFNAAGQANYSAGCTYKDSLAHRIRRSLNISTHIINWGYWGDVGIVASDDYRQRMQSMGIASISPKEGMGILETVLSNELDQVAAIKFA